jgi:hypothetical protein
MPKGRLRGEVEWLHPSVKQGKLRFRFSGDGTFEWEVMRHDALHAG